MSKPTCVLSWTKTEVGVTTTGGQSFWKPVSDCMELVRKLISERRKLGGEWQFTLVDSDGREVSLAEPEPVEFR